MKIKRYDHVHYGAVESDDLGAFVTYDDHEATVRLKMAEAERNGRAACRLELEWECRSWGMTLDEINQQRTFGDLLRALLKHAIKGVSK